MVLYRAAFLPHTAAGITVASSSLGTVIQLCQAFMTALYSTKPLLWLHILFCVSSPSYKDHLYASIWCDSKCWQRRNMTQFQWGFNVSRQWPFFVACFKFCWESGAAHMVLSTMVSLDRIPIQHLVICIKSCYSLWYLYSSQLSFALSGIGLHAPCSLILLHIKQGVKPALLGQRQTFILLWSLTFRKLLVTL